MTVATHEAEEMARRLAREEALFAGASSGANVVAVLRLAKRLGPAKTVVTLLVDSGLKYLTTDVYRLTEHDGCPASRSPKQATGEERLGTG